jgi:enamine deaminase RidA (YjgF/YER057c/UK114 family)
MDTDTNPITPSSRQWISSGTLWEGEVGYSRAVRVGMLVYVAGTVAADVDGNIHCPDDGYAQTVYALGKIKSALQQAGAELRHVVRTRIYVTSMEHAADVGRAHCEILGHIRPATTMVVVSELWGEGSVVEVEIDAVIDS